MKKRCFIVLIVIFILIIDNVILIDDNKKDSLIGVYLDNVESTSFPDKNSNYVVDKVVCDNDALASWDNNNWSLFVDNISKRSNCKIYFRSKKDITITYDNNYVKDNIFEEYYDVNSVGTLGYEYINFTVNHEYQNGMLYIISSSSLKDEYTSINGSYEYWLDYKKKLNYEEKYSLSFEARINNNNIDVTIGCEQDGYKNYILNKNWKKYTYEFTAHNTVYSSFIAYGWPSSTEKRIIEIRDISLQEGEYDNFSTVNLKEYDILSSTLPTPPRDNYTFLGWYTDSIEGEKISTETQVTEDTTFYAHWQYNS